MLSPGAHRHRRFPVTTVFVGFVIFCVGLFTIHRPADSQPKNINPPPSLEHEVAGTQPTAVSATRLHDTAQKQETLSIPAPTSETSPLTIQSALPLPPEYTTTAESGSSWCNDRFEVPYLSNLSKSQTEYCDSTGSTSSLRCFHSHVGENSQTDTFCVGGPAFFDAQEKRFKLNCQLRKFSAEEAMKSPPLERFPAYWYQTGPRILMNQYVRMDAPAEHVSELSKYPRKFTILVRREDVRPNLWHELMQVSSMVWTLDVLRMTRDASNGAPLFTAEDIENTRVLILDDMEDGPFYDLWTMFAKRPITKISQISEIDFGDSENIIIPLAGKSNPMWQGDWKPHSCSHSALLSVFSDRVLDFFKVDRTVKKDDSPLVLTFIDRHEKRRLMGKEDYVEELRKTYPDVKVQMVNFAAIPLAEQLKVIRGTDILVGVHGAGLTHAMFLPPDSALVEILPAEFQHKGFRNLAQMLGHRYFSSHAISNGTKGDWQQDDVTFDKVRFMQLLNTAVASMYNRRLLNNDVV